MINYYFIFTSLRHEETKELRAENVLIDLDIEKKLDQNKKRDHNKHMSWPDSINTTVMETVVCKQCHLEYNTSFSFQKPGVPGIHLTTVEIQLGDI